MDIELNTIESVLAYLQMLHDSGDETTLIDVIKQVAASNGYRLEECYNGDCGVEIAGLMF